MQGITAEIECLFSVQIQLINTSLTLICRNINIAWNTVIVRSSVRCQMFILGWNVPTVYYHHYLAKDFTDKIWEEILPKSAWKTAYYCTFHGKSTVLEFVHFYRVLLVCRLKRKYFRNRIFRFCISRHSAIFHL